MKRQLKIAMFIAVPVAVAAAVILYNHLSGDRPEPAAQQPNAAGGRTGARAIPIDIYITDYITLSEGRDIVGTPLAYEEVDVASEVAGKVEAIFFEEGTAVKKGQILLKINDDDLQSQLKRATFQRDLIKEKLDRSRILLEKDAISRESFDQVETDYKVIEADIQLLEVRIDKTSVKAPFDGIVGFRYVSPGSYIQAGTRIVHLVDNSRLKIEFSIQEKYFTNSLKGSEIIFIAENDPRPRRATIYAVDPVIDQMTRTITLRALYNNADMKITPGMLTRVVFGQKSGESLHIPTEAIVPDIQDKKVWIVRSGRAHLQSVETGTRNENMVEITGGLSQGDTVAITGLMQLKEGAQVTINN